MVGTNNIINTRIAQISQSWIGDAARMYTDKVIEYDKKVHAVCDSLNLLKDTYSKSLGDVQNMQSDVMNDINSI